MNPDEQVQVQVQNPWLVMVYLAGDNNLSEEMVLALQQILAEGPPTGDKIVAQFDPSGVGLSTQRYDFTDWKDGKRLEDYLDPNYEADETNTGTPEALSSFIEWAVGEHPGADLRYLLILSGHGSGTTEDFLLTDEAATDALSIDELEEALDAARQAIREATGADKKIDILGMDACFMSMGEVAYQIRDHVAILIGAEGMEPAFGWPYRRILARAKDHRKKSRNKAMDPDELAKMIVEEYIEYYSDYDRAAGRSADLAALELVWIDGIADAVRQLVGAFSTFGRDEHQALLLAHWYAQTYKFDQFVDLFDFCKQTRRRFPKGGHVWDLCTQATIAIERTVLLSGCSGFAHQHSHGLSVYFPWALVSPDYQELEFADVTKWHEFLTDHVKQTRREARFGARALRVPVPDSHKLALAQLCTRRLLGRGQLPEGVTAMLRPRLEKAMRKVDCCDIPPEDYHRELARRMLRGSGFGKHRYTGDGSKYTGNGSKYTGNGSKYTGNGSRSTADREKRVKNLPPVIGKIYWP